jgi:lysine 2,3-aminomutase
MPTLSLDVPSGGGKTTLVPNFMTDKKDGVRTFVGWDSRKGIYKNPITPQVLPANYESYLQEWNEIKNAKRPKV